MNQEQFPSVAKIRNNVDSQHCLQFAFMAAVETLGGGRLSVEDAERATGYQPGGTWPYSMLNWFAEHDFEVRHIENTDFERFVRDPRSELETQGLPEETINLFFEITDFPFETTALQRAIDDPRIELESRLPEASDIGGALDDGWLPLISLDAASLAGPGTDEFDGHMLLATAHEGSLVRLQDPGPPVRWDWDVTADQIVRSMRIPTPSSGTITLVRNRQREE